MYPGIDINIEDFDYNLPDEKIAQFPLEKRDLSRLLYYNYFNDQFEQDIFYNIPGHLPPKSFLVLNDSRVIHARLLFKKESGSLIEIFCLEPVNTDIQNAFSQKGSAVWKCLVGNNKRWKSGELCIEREGARLFAEKISQEGDNFNIGFSWKPLSLDFSDVQEIFGKVPLPPYISRDAVESDDIRYQTVFAKTKGSVAAPTAGLHFTEQMLKEMNLLGFKTMNLTLHVGAGTFKPVTSQNIAGHEMHEEHFSVSSQLINTIIQQTAEKAPIIPVGTTSARTLESLYWMGVKAILKLDHVNNLEQWEPYELNAAGINVSDSMTALLQQMSDRKTTYFEGTTRMIIVPGYEFKIAGGMITNFHQPRSTLLLLVAAMIGDKWKEAYRFALDNDFRFLSYGDCCLFLNKK